RAAAFFLPVVFQQHLADALHAVAALDQYTAEPLEQDTGRPLRVRAVLAQIAHVDVQRHRELLLGAAEELRTTRKVERHQSSVLRRVARCGAECCATSTRRRITARRGRGAPLRYPPRAPSI